MVDTAERAGFDEETTDLGKLSEALSGPMCLMLTKCSNPTQRQPCIAVQAETPNAQTRFTTEGIANAGYDITE